MKPILHRKFGRRLSGASADAGPFQRAWKSLYQRSAEKSCSLRRKKPTDSAIKVLGPSTYGLECCARRDLSPLQILPRSGLKLAEIREQLVNIVVSGKVQARQTQHALSRRGAFLAGLKWHKAEDLLPFFAMKAAFVDAHRRQWNREEIAKEFVGLFPPYAKKNLTYRIERTLVDSSDVVVAMVLWENATLASMEHIGIHRMGVVLVRENQDWAIALMQVTPVQPA